MCGWVHRSSETLYKVHQPMFEDARVGYLPSGISFYYISTCVKCQLCAFQRNKGTSCSVSWWWVTWSQRALLLASHTEERVSRSRTRSCDWHWRSSWAGSVHPFTHFGPWFPGVWVHEEMASPDGLCGRKSCGVQRRMHVPPEDTNDPQSQDTYAIYK